MSENPLTSLGELAKPATALIEKISGAAGLIFEPKHILMVAEAEAKASIIRAEGEAKASIIRAKADAEVAEIALRAKHRLELKEIKNQYNIESITQKSLPYLKEEAQPDKMENDWITNFFDKCGLISNSEMQELWAKILAGEANNPNSFSKRTVNSVSTLDKKDAELFTKFCQFVWQTDVPSPLIYDSRDKIYNDEGIYYINCKHLDSIGLISFNSIAGYTIPELSKNVKMYYYGKPVKLTFQKDSDNKLNMGHVMLTQVGQELATICNSTPNEDFYSYVLNKWKKEGITVVEVNR